MHHYAELSGRRVVVIGGTSGIGRAIAQLARQSGAEVVVGSRNQAKVDATVQALGPSASGMVIDVTDTQSVNDFFEVVGQIDYLVVTAADLRSGGLRELSLEDARASMESKFWGTYRVMRAAKFLPSTSVVLFSGIASRKLQAGSPIVSAVNAAVEALGKALAEAFKPVRVNVIAPGFTSTELWSEDPAKRDETLRTLTAKLPINRPGQPDEVAQAVLFLLVSSYITGVVLDVDGGALLG